MLPCACIIHAALVLQQWTSGAVSEAIGFPGGSEVNNLPAKQETQVRSLGWDDPLEKEMATHSRILAWKTPWTEEPGGLQSAELQGVGHNLATKQQQRQRPYNSQS